MARRVPAGEMRHLIRIKQHKIEDGSTAYDAYGLISASSTAWETGTVMRAKIEQLSGEEAMNARQIYPRATYLITVDYNSTLASTGGTRRAVLFDDRFMHVGGILNPDMENIQLQLLCGEER